jgi:hydroxyacylglutathione hydrolase
MKLIALPAFTDNYVWMLHDGVQAIVVDPGEATPVLRALDERGLQLRAIVVTHHHADHVGGVDALRHRLPDGSGPVYGPGAERIRSPSWRWRAARRSSCSARASTVIDVPGHTAGHIAYFGRPAGEAPILFCGDTLFSAAAAACSRAARRRCTTRCRAWPPCRATRACAVRTSTRSPT